MKAPLVRLPPSARVFPLGVAKLEDKNAILKFPEAGLTIRDGGDDGWAIVGDAEGRRLAVEVSRSCGSARGQRRCSCCCLNTSTVMRAL